MNTLLLSSLVAISAFTLYIPSVTVYQKPPSDAFYCAEWRDGTMKITGGTFAEINDYCKSQGA